MGDKDGKFQLLSIRFTVISMKPRIVIASLNDAAQGIFHKLYSQIIQAAVKDKNLFFQLRQILHPALYIVLHLLSGFHSAASPAGGSADYISGLVVQIHKGVGHGGKIAASLAAPVKKGLVQNALFQLWMGLGVDAGIQPVFLRFPALGADNVLHNLR